MRLNTFFQICIYITVAAIIFTLAINFVNTLGVFGGYGAESGAGIEDTTNETLSAFTKSSDYENGFVIDNLWMVVLAGVAGGLTVAWITHSTSVIGVYIFAYVFWGSFANVMDILYTNSFLNDIWGLVILATVGMSFIFIGAVAGMLSGSG